MKKMKLLLVSSSGGHFEQIKMLKPLEKKYRVISVTEKTLINDNADYYMIQTGQKDKLLWLRFPLNCLKAIKIWFTEKPDVVISTGTMIVLPFVVLAKLTGKKIIFIETFARIHDKTKTGSLLYGHVDLFIVQWKSLLDIYPNATYGGSIYS